MDKNKFESGNPLLDKKAELQRAEDLLGTAEEANFPEGNEEELRNTVEALRIEVDDLEAGLADENS